MKYYFMAGFIVLVGAVAVFLSQSKSALKSEHDHFAKKRNVAEAETKIRPPEFEDMKWKPSAAVEMRAPASTKK